MMPPRAGASLHASTRRRSMPSLRTTKRFVTLLTVPAVLLAAGLYAVAQQPYQLRRWTSPSATAPSPWAGPSTTSCPPRSTRRSGAGSIRTSRRSSPSTPGDTVAVETMMHAHNAIQPGTTMDDIVKLRLANPGGGPHSVTGPIYVNGAEPGDMLEIRIKKIVPEGVRHQLPPARLAVPDRRSARAGVSRRASCATTISTGRSGRRSSSPAS